MSKFKVGDNVLYIGRDKSNYKNGEIFLVNKIEENHRGEFLYTASGKPHTYPGCLESDLTYPPFTQQDLEIGMWYEYENGDVGSILNEVQLENIKRANIKYAYKRNENGDFIKLWERSKEKLYELKLPNVIHVDDNYIFRTRYNDYTFGSEICRDSDIIKFTQKEIDNLPNQELIKALVKVEVE